jgi:endoglucanase
VTARAALFAALLLCCAQAAIDTAAAEPGAERLAVLRRGVNITNWFRFPPSLDPTALRGYLGDPALRDLKRAGFTFVRLPVQPEVFAAPGAPAALADAIGRIQHQGLGVVVSVHPVRWRLETAAEDRVRLGAIWRSLVLVLRWLEPSLTFAEILNEPVFAGEPQAWATLQRQLLAEIRAGLPANTIVLTGNDWGSIRGLLATVPEPDPNVVYSFHLYEPVELTALAAYRSGLDTAALARLPFLADNEAACQAVADTTRDPPTADLIRFYCGQRWDGAKVAALIGSAAAWGRRNRAPLLAGEFGASEKLNAPARLAWLAAVREACERHGIGWALWGYDDSMGFALRPPARQRPLDVRLLHALGLPEGVPEGSAGGSAKPMLRK